MKKFRHTKGSWIAVGYQVETICDNEPDICNCWPEVFGQSGRKPKEIEANARLIAAAPELLMYLNLMIDLFDKHDDCEDLRTTVYVRNSARSLIESLKR
jgi:hypothetical protein